jgi:hypothetical protein
MPAHKKTIFEMAKNHVTENLRLSSNTLSPLQRQNHTKNARRLEISYLIFLLLEAIFLLSAAIWLLQVEPNPGTDYKMLPTWFIVPSYLFLIGVILSTALRYSCCTCTKSTVSNIDTAIFRKLMRDPFIVFNTMIATCLLVLELSDPSSNITYANSLVFFCQFISVIFSDALIRADKWFNIINVTFLLFQAIVSAISIIFVAKDRFYFLINTTLYTRNLSKRYLLVQIIASLTPVLLEVLQDPHRYRIRLLSLPLNRFEVASAGCFLHLSKKQKYAVLQLLVAKENRLHATQKRILNNYGGYTKEVKRIVALQFSEPQVLPQPSLNRKAFNAANKEEANYIASARNSERLESLIQVDEIVYSILITILLIIYMIESRNQHKTVEIDIVQQVTNSSTPSQNTNYKYYDYSVATVASLWICVTLIILTVIRRLYCCGHNSNVDIIILKKVVTDPIVVYLSLCGFLMVLTDVVWPGQYGHINVTLKLGYFTLYITMMLSDALIQVSRWSDVFVTAGLILAGFNNQINVWSGNGKQPDIILFNSTCSSPIGPLPTFTKASLLGVLYTQLFLNMILVLYRVWWDKRRMHIRLVTGAMYRHDFMDVAELNLRSAKKAEELMKYIAGLIDDISSIKQRCLEQVQDDIVRRTTLDDESKMIEMSPNPLES